MSFVNTKKKVDELMTNEKNNSVILKIDQLVSQNVAENRIRKYYGYIDATGILSLLDVAELAANPRKPTRNKVTEAILETLTNSPEFLSCRSKGLLVSSSNVEELQRQRLRLSFNFREAEDVLDGGHNLFAISSFVIESLLNGANEKLHREIQKISTWYELKPFWNKNKDLLLSLLKEEKETFKFSAPIEILTIPSDSSDLEEKKHEFLSVICDICQARNLNEELHALASGNQRHIFDVVKNALKPELNKLVAWTTGEEDKDVKGEYVLLLVAMIFNQLAKQVKENGRENSFLTTFKCTPSSFYASRGSVTKNVREVLEDLNNRQDVDIDDANALIDSLNLLKELPLIWDTIEMNFPKLYNAFGGRDGNGGSYGSLTPFSKKTSKGKDASLKKDKPCRFRSPNCVQKKGFYETQDGYVAPLMCSITAFMQYDKKNNCLRWDRDINEILTFYSDTSKGAAISDAIKTLGMFITGAVHGDPQLLGKSGFAYDPVITFVKTAIS